MKKHKSRKSTEASTSDSKAKVFVLTPDLLAQLGINLNTVPQSEVVPLTTGIVKDNIQTVDHIVRNCLPENEEAPSIIQTANLMKESVFLSPTFFQTTPIVESENEEPVELVDQPININTTTSPECGAILYQSNKSSVFVNEINSISEENDSQLPNNSIAINPNAEVPLEKVISTENYESVKEYQVENDGDLILTDVLYRNSENDKNSSDKLKTTVIVDEHSDEAYLSDCSNTYSGCSPESNISEINKQNPTKNKTQNIPIMIATDLQFRNIEDMNMICSTTDAAYTPVDVNSTVISHEDCSDMADKKSTVNSAIVIKPKHAQNSESQNLPEESIIPWIAYQGNKIELKIDSRDSVFEESVNENKDSYVRTAALENQKENFELVLAANNPEPAVPTGNSDLNLKENFELVLSANNSESGVPTENSDLNIRENFESVLSANNPESGVPAETSDLNIRENFESVLSANNPESGLPTENSDLNIGQNFELVLSANNSESALPTENSDLNIKENVELVLSANNQESGVPIENSDLNTRENFESVLSANNPESGVPTENSDLNIGQNFELVLSANNSESALPTENSDLNIKENVELVLSANNQEFGVPTENSDLNTRENFESVLSANNPESGVPTKNSDLNIGQNFELVLSANNSESGVPTENSDLNIRENVELVLSANNKESGVPTENSDLNIRGTPINDKIKKSFKDTDKSNCDKNIEIRLKDKDKKESVTNCSNTQDRVKEIAKYLSEINKRKNNIRNCKSIKVKGAKGEPVISKLCIQGVEKPGGKLIQKDVLKCVSVSKTYKRAVIRQQIPKVVKMPDAITTSDTFQITDSNNENQGAKVRALTHQNEFCICYDFGDLAYYDCEMLYEHIHFWSHKNIDYESEVLYSIYHEDTMFSQSVDFIEDTHHDAHNDNITLEEKLCWNEMNTQENNEEKCELATSTHGKSAHPSNMKRHIDAVCDKSPVAIVEAKKHEAKTKKCGVCNKTMSQKEWVTHKQKEHGSVVWEVNRKLDFKDKNVLKSLNETLKKLGFVKCPICLNGFSKVSEYKSHLKKCSQEKSNVDTGLKPSTSVQSIELTTKSTKSKSLNVEIMSNKGDKNVPESSVVNESVSEVTPKRIKKSVDVTEVKSSGPMKKSSKSKNVVASLTVDTSPSSKNYFNTIESEKLDSSTKNTSKAKAVDKSKTNKVSVDIAVVNNNTMNPKNTAKHPQKSNKSLEPSKKSEHLAKLVKPQKNSVQDFSDKTNIKTYGKSACNDTSTEIQELKSTRKNNDKHQEAKTETTKSAKRPSNAVIECSPAKRAKRTKSSVIVEILGDVSMKQPIRVKVENESIPDEQNKTVEITISNPSFPNEGMDTVTEDSSIAYDSIDDTMEEATLPDDSFAAAADTSTFSTDATMNESQPTEYFMVLAPINESDEFTICGVCQEAVAKSQWIEHIAKSHDYIAWHNGEPPLDVEDEVNLKKYLNGIANEHGGLACSKCGLVRKFAKAYLRHIKNCEGSEEGTPQDLEEELPLDPKSRKCRENAKSLPPFTCGVCNDTVEQSAWIEHIRTAHKYLAWTTEEQPLNLDDAKEVKEHLKYISKHHGGLICGACGVKWNYVKKYLTHINDCVGKSAPRVERKKPELVLPPVVTCGVCKLDVKGKDWIKHIQVAHEYMAWIMGEEPLDPNDPEQVKKHLDTIVGTAGPLVCSKCGEMRKFTRAYLQHTAVCDRTGFRRTIDEPATQDKNKYTCGVCRQTGNLSEWTEHAMKMHYNVAWKVGDPPINLRNPYSVEKYMKVYKKKHGLICHNCKNSRTSCYGFYAHVLTCGKTDEEIDAVHDVCELCNNKYLCIYRNQHMAAHRDSDQRRERREMLARKAEEEADNPPPEPEPEPAGKRRAAEKAKKVIQKHSTNIIDGMHVCGCGAAFKDAEELSQHSCDHKKTDDGNDSDVSVKIENVSEESADEIVDSGVSDEEDEKSKKKRVRVGEGSTKVQRMPYRVSNYTSYLSQAYKDFVKLHYTNENLFDGWRDSPYQTVPADEMAKYLPQVTESCKVRFSAKEDWTTLARFEAKKIKGFSMYIGGATQCIAWAPPNSDESSGQFLAVCAARGPDIPRLGATDRPHFPAALQIWDCGNFDVLPQCVLCIAHEYGLVWGMDWCPSGARDYFDSEQREELKSSRLGLLAVACSNGSAYIYAVPYTPRPQHQEPVMYKLQPVAELRLAMTAGRQLYQATSIKWSQQKGHSVVVVGYSDGTTALYDLGAESPMLTAVEKGVSVFYPFRDRRVEGTSVTGVGVYATANEAHPVGGQYSASITGSTLCGAGPRPTARLHLAAGGAQLAAHWPAVTLAGDTPFMRCVSEMEWWGGGRHAGAARAWASCARCSRAACAAPPALRALRHHPVYPDIKKLVVALLLMVPLGKKPKSKNDDLSVVMEPLTYEDAAAKYGLELSFVTKSSRKEQVQAQQICNENESQPDRFPLGDIVALSFCPSARFHDKIAAATQTGIIFLITL